MTTTEIQSLKKAKPFRPFRIFTTLGERFDVTNPHQIMVAGNTILIGVEIDPEDELPGGMEYRGIEFIERTEELAQPVRRPQ